MPRASDGTVSFPSNSFNPAVEGQYADEGDWNTLRDDIGTMLQDTLSRSGKGKVTSHVDFDENASPGTPASNVGRLYVADVAGATALMFKDAAGNTHDLTTVGPNLSYSFDTSTTTNADPGAGKIRFNSATFVNISAIAFDDLDALGADVSAEILAWDNLGTASNRGYIVLQRRTTTSTVRNTFLVIDSISDQAGWSVALVQPVSSTGNFSSGDPLTVAYYPPGPTGPVGGGDVTGPASSTSGGIVRFNGTSGKIIADSAPTVSTSDLETTLLNRLDPREGTFAFPFDNIATNGRFATWTSRPTGDSVGPLSAASSVGQLPDGWIGGPGSGGTYTVSTPLLDAATGERYLKIVWNTSVTAGSGEHPSATRATYFENIANLPVDTMAGETFTIEFDVKKAGAGSITDIVPIGWLSFDVPAWTTGEAITSGMQRTTAAARIYVATTSATTGGTEPTGTGTGISDGGVTWNYVGEIKGRTYELYEQSNPAGSVKPAYNTPATGAAYTLTTSWVTVKRTIVMPALNATDSTTYSATGDATRTLVGTQTNGDYWGFGFDIMGLPTAGAELHIRRVRVYPGSQSMRRELKIPDRLAALLNTPFGTLMAAYLAQCNTRLWTLATQSAGGGLAFSGSTLTRGALTGEVTAAAGSSATTIANDAVTFAKMQNITTDRLLGRDTSSTGDVEELTVGGGLEFSGSGGIQRGALTGDVTASAGSSATTIANDAVTYAKIQNVSATDKVLGRSSSGAGDVEEIACTAAGRALLGLTGSADKVAYLTGSGTAALADFTSSGAWTSWTPTIVSEIGTLTTVTSTAAWCRIGRTIFIRLYIDIVDNGTGSTQAITATLPVTAKTAEQSIPGSENGSSYVALQGRIGAVAGYDKLRIVTYTNGYPGATGGKLIFTGCYEAAA